MKEISRKRKRERQVIVATETSQATTSDCEEMQACVEKINFQASGTWIPRDVFGLGWLVREESANRTVNLQLRFSHCSSVSKELYTSIWFLMLLTFTK